MEWRAYRPHLIEFGILVVFYALVAGGCYFVRLDQTGGLILGAVAYAYLLVIPVATGLIVWTYDTFLHGIAFDSISMDLIPLFVWFPADSSIFLYVFMLIFFAVAALFFLGTRCATEVPAQQRGEKLAATEDVRRIVCMRSKPQHRTDHKAPNW